MRILRDFKIPNFKFPKFKMKEVSEIDEMNIDYEKLKNAQDNKNKKELKNYEQTNYKTIKEVFLKSIKEYENNPFILEKFKAKENYEVITYKQFGEDVISFGTALVSKYNLKNSKVIIIGENTYHWYVSYMAMLCGVGIAVPVDKELPENEIENVIKRSNAKAIIYSSKKKDVIKKVADKLKDVDYFIQMNSDDELSGRDIGMNTIINEGKNVLDKRKNDFINIEINPDEFKVLIFTSGTTSNSKGVMICNRNLADNINAVSAYVKIEQTDRLFSVLPLHHTYESTIGFLVPFANGASIAICQGLKYIVPNLKETNPTIMLTVPLLVENLYKKINANIKKSKKDGMVNSMIHITNVLKNIGVDIKRKVFNEIYENLGGKIRIIVSAAAPIDPQIGKWVEDIGIIFLQGYGLTETAPISALTPEFKTKVGSAGKAVTCAEIKIDDPNENGEGEVLIKSSTLMLGYYQDEEATNKVVKDGWFNSGDIGYIDEDGFLYITGRSKNVIVTQNGKNIYPEEIELLLAKIPEIAECMVYGKSQDGNKELTITAKVIPNYTELESKYKKDLTKQEIHDIIWKKIKENVNKALTSYKAIKCLEIKEDEFEKTTTMKIKRYKEIQKSK